MGGRAITTIILNIAFSMTHTLTFTACRKIIPSSCAMIRINAQSVQAIIIALLYDSI